MAILDEIRDAIESADESRYAMAKATGISQAQLSRLMSGKRNVSVATLEILATHLGLEVVLRKRRSK